MLKTFCFFVFHKEFQFGIVKKQQKKWQVQGVNASYNLTKNSILWHWQEELEQNENTYLAQKQQEFVDFLVDLPIVYTLCTTEKKYSLADLVSLVFPSKTNEWQKVFLYAYLLQKGQSWFFHQNGFFQKKTEQEKNLWFQKQEQKDFLVLKTSLESQWAKLLLQTQIPKYQKQEQPLWDSFYQRICAFVHSPETHQEKEYFHKLFCLHSEKQEHFFLKILQLLQIDISWQSWLAKKAGVCEHYSEEVLTNAADLKKNYFQLLTPKILDETHLQCYTIDNPKTKDFDDAISIEKRTNGYTIRLHISDVASFIKEDSPIFQHLEQYLFSSYTLTKVYHLLPSILSCQTFSLVQKETKRVMSFAFVFDNNYQLLENKIYFSKIRVQKNISYQTADEWISKKTSWQFLEKICTCFLQQRIKNGALYFDRQEVQIDISEPQNIRVFTVNTSSPAYLVVSELAIQANSLVAKEFIQQDCQAIFRKQAPYKRLHPEVTSEKLQLEHFSIAPAFYTLTADKHCGLGLNVYSQITSPIRRFPDLLGQKILSAIIQKKEIPFQNGYLLGDIDMLQNKSFQYTQLERKISNYWKIKYLEQNFQKIFTIKPLRNHNGCVVLFLELQLVHPVTSVPLKIGELYQAKVKKIYYPEQLIFLEIID